MMERLLRLGLAAGLDFSLDARGRGLAIKVKPAADLSAARELIYPLLAAEERLFITVDGAPACLMPDAAEHFTWPLGAAGPFRRIRACAGCALKGRCPGAPAGFPAELAGPVLPAPAELVIELNKNCNLTCRACFGRGAEELPEAAAARAMREAAGLGVKNLRFTGGEPLLYPGLERLLRLGRKLGFYNLLNTNATLFDKAAARRLGGLVDNALVSLPAADEAAHAAQSGRPGALALKAAAVGLMRRAGVKVIRAGSVISRQLAEDFPAWRGRVGRMGFGIWELYRPMLDRRALAAAPEYDIRLSDIRRIAAALPEQGDGRPRAVLANPVPFCAIPAAARPWALGARFDDGWTRLVLEPSGHYKPSYPSKARLGVSLTAAWGSRRLRACRSYAWLPERCRSCRMLAACLGGSRYQAELAGDALGPDPWMKR